MKKNRKKFDIEAEIEKQMNCWDQVNRNFKNMSDNFESIGKSLKEITANSTMIKNFCNESTEHNELIDNTHRNMSKSLNRLKATKINITSIRKNLPGSSSISPTLRLPN